MQTTPKIQEVHDSSDTIIESCTAILRAEDLSAIRNEFNAKQKSRLYTATSKFGATIKITSLCIAIILLIPLLIFKFGLILIFRPLFR